MVETFVPTVEKILQRAFCFRGIEAGLLEQLATFSHVKTCAAGETIFLEGDPADHFYIVLSGQVKIYKLSAEGKEMILHLFGPQSVFAEVPVFGDMKCYPAHAMGLLDSELLAIDGQAFRDFSASHPKLLLQMLSVFAQRLREFNGLIEDLSLRSVDSRLAKYLLSLSEQTPDKTVLHVHKKTLAAILGTVPESLSRSFKKLADQGVVTVQGQEVSILDRAALQTVASVDEDDTFQN